MLINLLKLHSALAITCMALLPLALVASNDHCNKSAQYCFEQYAKRVDDAQDHRISSGLVIVDKYFIASPSQRYEIKMGKPLVLQEDNLVIFIDCTTRWFCNREAAIFSLDNHISWVNQTELSFQDIRNKLGPEEFLYLSTPRMTHDKVNDQIILIHQGKTFVLNFEHQSELTLLTIQKA